MENKGKETPSPELTPPKPAPPKKVLTPRMKDLIRRRLAEGKAMEKIDAVFARLESSMDEWRRKKLRYAHQHQPGEKPPADLDFAALAKANGLTSRQTPLISAVDASEYAIGRSRIDDRIPFTTYAYQTLAMLKPTRSTDDRGRPYCFGS